LEGLMGVAGDSPDQGEKEVYDAEGASAVSAP